ncbi:hypothetical protein MNBD_PLANCTO03-1373 [hydrothermal vent metagenome]|uniref:Uncharacterized protein n=1 Tax=hydrothermal vent metagenome TaxID=652676 RepID=A0A3B1D9T4_9ZZZZ
MTYHHAAASRGMGSFVSCLARPLALAAVVLGSLVAPAHADEFIDRLNAGFADVRDSRRSDTVILAALVELMPPPAGVETPRSAALQPASGSAWAAAEAWATGPTQVAVLEALDRITQEDDIRRAMVFAQPYGLSELGSSSEQIAFLQAGLYTDLGDPPLLSAARHLYLDRFEQASCLVHVEATRRLASGDPVGALDVLADWVYFGRQIANRKFHAEKAWAFETMILAVERLRDVVYVDFQAGHSLTGEELIRVIERLADKRGPMSIDRIKMPEGDFLGAEQLIAGVMVPRGNVRPELFAPTMARLASTRRPLRLFGEAARWKQIANTHADWFVTNKTLISLRDDYAFRWTRSRFDRLLAQPFVVERFVGNEMVRDAVAVVTRSVPDMRDLFTLRLLLRVELIGTRDALGLVGFYVENNAYPLDLSAIRPRFVPELEIDPFNPSVTDERKPPLEFFVPIRDTKDRFSARGTVPPHEISVIVPDAPNVVIRLRDDQFVLFSTGADGAADWADEVQNTPDAPSGRDYLLWPPVLSIVRETLTQAGRFD